jgi:hypothetical protein
MVINSTNINKTKESLTVMGNNSTNINKTKERLNSDDHPLFKLSLGERWLFVMLILVELMTITV